MADDDATAQTDGARGEKEPLYPAGRMWRSWGIWRWRAHTHDGVGHAIEHGKGWALTRRGAWYDRNIWLHHHGSAGFSTEPPATPRSGSSVPPSA